MKSIPFQKLLSGLFYKQKNNVCHYLKSFINLLWISILTDKKFKYLATVLGSLHSINFLKLVILINIQ